MKEILDFKVFCNCVSLEDKVILTPYFAETNQEKGLPIALSIRFNPDATKANLAIWWEIKAALRNDNLIIIASDYEAFSNGVIECLICSKKKQYKLNKVISNIKLAISYLQTATI